MNKRLFFIVCIICLIGCDNSDNNDNNKNNDDIQVFAGEVNNINDQVIVDFQNALNNANLNLDGKKATNSINWDGNAVLNITQGATANLPTNLFLVGAGERQLIIGDVDDQQNIINEEQPTITEDNFATLADGVTVNPSNNTNITAFTAPATFSGFGTNIITFVFKLEDKKTTGLINGFGAIFTDVEIDGRSGLRFFNAKGEIIREEFLSAGNDGGHQFIGVIFPENEVAFLQLMLGNNEDFGNELEDIPGDRDFVAVDNIFFPLSEEEYPTTDIVEEILNTNSDAFINTDRLVQTFAGNNGLGSATFDSGINWDGAAVTALTNGATANFPKNLFLVGAGFRQLTIGEEPEPVAVSEDNFATLVDGTLNPSANNGTDNFTPFVTFGVFTDDSITIKFFLADQITPALVRNFSAVFTDVEVANRSGISFFDVDDNLIHTVKAKALNSGSNQIVGSFFSKPIIAKVVIDLPDNVNFGINVEDPNGSDPIDHVVVDNLLFERSNTTSD
ncbi:hypothetical protein [Candidatus Uabimicrobium sp. HlEnr_7]|uniref:hypothetical protein n=1 Tax=Candidatus Uabimicrobium helgolandensis TaxID=3095367 RepID=UPI003555F111